MKLTPLALIFSLILAGPVLADGGHQHSGHTQNLEEKTKVTLEGNTLTLTFGPMDLPTGHDGDLAASIPKHIFTLVKDRHMVGYKSAIYTKDGPLPRQWLHHVLLMNLDKDSVSCPGEPLFFAGAGMEMTETRFPKGYGVRLEKDKKLMVVVAFYHKALPTKDAMASFTIELAPEGAPIQDMDVYQVGVNIVCYSKFDQRGPNQTDEGIIINPGLQVQSAPLKFNMDGCVKFAYPHGHDQLLLIALDNKTTKKTLLRTVPDVELDGNFRAFQPHQVYKDDRGFSVNTKDEYEMTMVYHRPLHDPLEGHGMGNYLLYMTPGTCPGDASASAQ